MEWLDFKKLHQIKVDEKRVESLKRSANTMPICIPTTVYVDVEEEGL